MQIVVAVVTVVVVAVLDIVFVFLLCLQLVWKANGSSVEGQQ